MTPGFQNNSWYNFESLSESFGIKNHIPMFYLVPSLNLGNSCECHVFAKKILILLIHKGNIPYLEPAAIENILDKIFTFLFFKITYCFTKTIRVHSGIRKFR